MEHLKWIAVLHWEGITIKDSELKIHSILSSKKNGTLEMSSSIAPEQYVSIKIESVFSDAEGQVARQK